MHRADIRLPPVEAHAPTRVLVIDRHTVIRDALKRLCEEIPELEFAGGAENVTEAMDLLPADVVLLDLGLMSVDESSVRRLRECLPAGRLVGLADETSDGAARPARSTGSIPAIPKAAPIGYLVRAVRSAAAGDPLPELDARADQSPLARLSPREREVLALLAGGGTSRDIARSLGISTRTISSHIGSIYRKLGIGGRVEATRLALELGLGMEREPGPGGVGGSAPSDTPADA